MRSFAKIKPSRKFPNLQYSKHSCLSLILENHLRQTDTNTPKIYVKILETFNKGLPDKIRSILANVESHDSVVSTCILISNT